MWSPTLIEPQRSITRQTARVNPRDDEEGADEKDNYFNKGNNGDSGQI